MQVEQVAMLLLAAVAAGWVDAVVGGGGLIQLPALMLLNPGQPVAAALATNKLASIAGASSAAVAYMRKAKPDLGVAMPAAGLAVCCAAGGALCAAAISSELLKPLIMVVLLAVAAIVVLKPDLGRAPAGLVLRTRRRTAAAVLVPGVPIAFYDGLVGPGTGTFLVIAFTTLLGVDFVNASANAKIINTGTNLGALVVFAAQGHVLWALGLAMAVCNVAGALLGARMAINRGAGFVRVVLLCVVAALVLKLGYEQFG